MSPIAPERSALHKMVSDLTPQLPQVNHCCPALVLAITEEMLKFSQAPTHPCHGRRKPLC